MRNRRGRRRLNPDEAAVTLKFPAALLERIDEFADEEICTRADAIRALVEKGLAR